MGHAYAYRCRNCGYEEQFYHGHGFLVHSQPVKEYLKQRTKLFHYKTHNLIRRLSKTHSSLFIRAGFQVYKCPHCKIIHDKIEVILSDGDEIIHKSEFRCPDCRARMKRTNIHRLNKAICPVCRKKTFQIDHQHHYLWD